MTTHSRHRYSRTARIVNAYTAPTRIDRPSGRLAPPCFPFTDLERPNPGQAALVRSEARQ